MRRVWVAALVAVLVLAATMVTMLQLEFPAYVPFSQNCNAPSYISVVYSQHPIRGGGQLSAMAQTSVGELRNVLWTDGTTGLSTEKQVGNFQSPSWEIGYQAQVFQRGTFRGTVLCLAKVGT